MNQILTIDRNLDQELSDPYTSFMESLLREIEHDLDTVSTELNYHTFTREEVDSLISKNMKESEEMYKRREETYCKWQLKKTEKKPKKLKKNLFNNAESDNDEDYFADTEMNDLSDLNDDDPTMGCLKIKFHCHQIKRHIKKSRKMRSHQLEYLSHNIHHNIRDVYIARQFIKEAEDNLKAKGEDVRDTVNRVRELYCNTQRNISLYTVSTCLAVTKDVKIVDAIEFDKQMRASGEHVNF